MKMLLPLLLLVLVSQHALAQVVEVYEGEISVLLPCKYSGFIPEDNPTVLWTRSDLNPKSVHLQREETDDLKGQNQRYINRTSMRSDALDTLDFSLTLTKPQMTDSSIYTCSIGNEREELKLTDIQLLVKDQQVEVKVEEGSDSVTLPCNTTPDLAEDTTVEWTRSDQELTVVQVYSNNSDHPKQLDNLYCGRAKMNKDLLRTGDLSLTLKYPAERDSGGYICTIYRDKDILRQKVVLQVKERFPSWAKALVGLLIALVLVVVVSGALLYHFRHYFMSVIMVEVEVKEEAESVQLPFKTTKNLLGEIQVIWERYEPQQKAYMFKDNTNKVEEQHEVYRGRTVMNEYPLKTGDLSLTLIQPKDDDSGEYKCLVWRKGTFIRKKTVLLKLVCQVEVEEGVESVQLPFKSKENLPKDAKVKWRDSSYNMVHLYKNRSDQPHKQHQVYSNRTKMNKHPLRTGDLSLTLNMPTKTDSGRYSCDVVRNSTIIRKKIVHLEVKGRVQVQDQTGDIRNRSSSIDPTSLMADQSVWSVCDQCYCQVQFEQGAESVQLPLITTQSLPEDAELDT